MNEVNNLLSTIYNNIEKTFVYEQTEVRLTGRKATNQLRSGKVDEVVEITPVDSMQGQWKKWVRQDNLFEVK
jgi:hypothetical protein